MSKALDVAFKAADSDATVLLLGESGTGKSVLARQCIEKPSKRRCVRHGELSESLA